MVESGKMAGTLVRYTTALAHLVDAAKAKQGKIYGPVGVSHSYI